MFADFFDDCAALFRESAIKLFNPRIEGLKKLSAAHVDRLIKHAEALIDFLREMARVVANSGSEMVRLCDNSVDQRAAMLRKGLIDGLYPVVHRLDKCERALSQPRIGVSRLLGKSLNQRISLIADNLLDGVESLGDVLGKTGGVAANAFGQFAAVADEIIFVTTQLIRQGRNHPLALGKHRVFESLEAISELFGHSFALGGDGENCVAGGRRQTLMQCAGVIGQRRNNHGGCVVEVLAQRFARLGHHRDPCAKQIVDAKGLFGDSVLDAVRAPLHGLLEGFEASSERRAGRFRMRRQFLTDFGGPLDDALLKIGDALRQRGAKVLAFRQKVGGRCLAFHSKSFGHGEHALAEFGAGLLTTFEDLCAMTSHGLLEGVQTFCQSRVGPFSSLGDPCGGVFAPAQNVLQILDAFADRRSHDIAALGNPGERVLALAEQGVFEMCNAFRDFGGDLFAMSDGARRKLFAVSRHAAIESGDLERCLARYALALFGKARDRRGAGRSQRRVERAKLSGENFVGAFGVFGDTGGRLLALTREGLLEFAEAIGECGADAIAMFCDAGCGF